MIALLIVTNCLWAFFYFFPRNEITWFFQTDGNPYYIFRGPNPNKLYKRKTVHFRLRKIDNPHNEILKKEE